MTQLDRPSWTDPPERLELPGEDVQPLGLLELLAIVVPAAVGLTAGVLVAVACRAAAGAP